MILRKRLPIAYNRERSRGGAHMGTSKLVAVVLALSLLGVVMVASASLPYSSLRYSSPAYLLIKHLAALALGMAAFWFCSRFSYSALLYGDHILLLIALGMTAVTLIPGVSVRGSWLKLPGPFQPQPTEFLKLALIVSFAASCVRKGEQLREFSRGVLPTLLIASGAALMALAQSDFAMALIFFLIALYMLFIGGARLSHLLACVLLALPALALLVIAAPYRFSRLLSFLDPFAYSTTEGYQLIQSLTAIGSGGIVGRGLGASREKLLFLPEPYNDFIFAIIGEELGLIGGLFVIGLYAALVWMGYSIAARAPDRLGMLLASGITFTIAAQAAINLGVATGILPVTGLTLPFISYGGSSLIVSLAMTGILLNIARRSSHEGVSHLWRRNGRASLSRSGSLTGAAAR